MYVNIYIYIYIYLLQQLSYAYLRDIEADGNQDRMWNMCRYVPILEKSMHVQAAPGVIEVTPGRAGREKNNLGARRPDLSQNRRAPTATTVATLLLLQLC